MCNIPPANTGRGCSTESSFPEASSLLIKAHKYLIKSIQHCKLREIVVTYLISTDIGSSSFGDRLTSGGVSVTNKQK